MQFMRWGWGFRFIWELQFRLFFCTVNVCHGNIFPYWEHFVNKHFFNVGSLHVTNWNHVFAKFSGKAQPLNCTGSTCHCRDTSHFITLSLCIPWHFIDILQALVPRFLCFFSMVPIKGSNTQQLLQELIAFFQGTITSLFE